jgi:hypothetical protein
VRVVANGEIGKKLISKRVWPVTRQEPTSGYACISRTTRCACLVRGGVCEYSVNSWVGSSRLSAFSLRFWLGLFITLHKTGRPFSTVEMLRRCSRSLECVLFRCHSHNRNCGVDDLEGESIVADLGNCRKHRQPVLVHGPKLLVSNPSERCLRSLGHLSSRPDRFHCSAAKSLYE